MNFKLGKFRCGVTWSKTPLFDTLFGGPLNLIDVGRVHRHIEIGTQDVAGGKHHYLGIGRLTITFVWFNKDYRPAYWKEQDEQLAKLKAEREKARAEQKVPPPPMPKDPNVVPFASRRDPNPKLH